MPRNLNKYEYETSPRKLEPEYTPLKKPSPSKKYKNQRKTNKNSDKSKAKKQKQRIIKYVMVSFAILFAISYRNSKIDEGFAKVQNLKQELSEFEKQNAQLQVSIENSLNLNNLEKEAKELLGMQKLTSKQTKYISLPKSDYIEASTETVIIEDNSNIFQSIIEKIEHIFK